jgi:membrane protease YdiL (CAAX protease family)
MREEWRSLIQSLRAERRALVICVSSAALLTLAWYPAYHSAFEALLGGPDPSAPYRAWLAHGLQFAADIALLVLIPALIVRFVLRERLSDMGLRVGDWRFGLKYVALASLAMAPLLWVGSADPELMAEYPLPRLAYGLEPGDPFLWELTYLVYYVAWEFHFRGYLQLGLERRLGPALSIVIQLLPSVLIHVRKPFGETLSAIPGAFLMGILVWRTRSILWAILLHWAIGAMTDLFCYIRLTG